MLKRTVLAVAAVTVLAVPALAADLAVDTAKSSVKWKGEKKLVSSNHHGILKLKSGKVQTDAKGLVTGGEFVIDMGSIDNQDLKDPKDKAKLEGHLKSEDFFAVEKFPTAKFVVKSVTPGGAADQFKVAGDLTIRDKTNPVEFAATIKKNGADYTAKSDEFTIDRSKFDVKYNSGKFFDPAALGDKIIKDELTVALDLVAH